MNLEGLTFDDVLLRPQYGVVASRKDVDISSYYFELDIPLISAPMPSVASVDLLKEITRLGGAGVINRMNTTPSEQIKIWDEVGHENCYIAIGLDYSSFVHLRAAGIKRFVLDVAHCHSIHALEFLSKIRSSEITIIAGNVATEEGARSVYSYGANAIKVGIGPGAVCTTRQVTGFGVPQLEAISESSKAPCPVLADGGIRNSGDIVKALAAGADAVMIGTLFAHSKEANNGGSHYGCASAMVNGSRAPEGIHTSINPAVLEPLEDIVERLIGGLRSAISYGGGKNIQDLQENADWIKLTDAGRKESKLA